MNAVNVFVNFVVNVVNVLNIVVGVVDFAALFAFVFFVLNLDGFCVAVAVAAVLVKVGGSWWR